MKSEAEVRPPEARVMFVYSFIYVARPFAVAEPAVLKSFHKAGPVAANAYRDGERIRSRVGVGAPSGALAKTVELDVGEPVRGPTETSIPITWRATGTPGLFPVLRGEFVVAAVGDTTQLALRGSYEPPLGAVGRALDRIVLHRIAEASVKSFVDRIAAMIRHPGGKVEDQA